MRLQELENKICYIFRDKELLQSAGNLEVVDVLLEKK